MLAPADRGLPPRDGRVPLLSVLITSWNAAPTIERAITSVLEDDRLPVECVVVDDASQDGTADVVAALAARDPRVVLVRVATNGGVSAARNRGLDVARGTWLTFLDADDRLLPGGIGALMAPTSDEDILAVVGQRVWTDGTRTWVSRFYDIPDIREPGRKSIATHPGLVYYASATGKAFHRSLLGGLRFEGRLLGDQPWAIRALLRAQDRVAVIDDTIYEWSRPPRGSVATSITAASRTSALRSAEAARVARRAYLEVSAEVDLQVADEATRTTIRRTYAERLIRSDFGSALKPALDRRDPTLGELFVAIGEFLDVIPDPIITQIDAVFRELIRPAWERWDQLSPGARRGYWRMLDPVRRSDPSVEIRLLGSRRLVPALRVAHGVTTLSPALGGATVNGIKALAERRRARRSR